MYFTVVLRESYIKGEKLFFDFIFVLLSQMSFIPTFPWSEYVYLIVGFVFLIQWANTLVSGASSIAKTLWISPLVIGLTIVAFGTSAPELFVNVLSAFRGQTDLALGNILWSNIANTWLILGVAAMIYPLQAQNSTIYKEVPFSLLSSFVLLFLAFDVLISWLSTNILVRWESLVLLCFFVIFFTYTFALAKNTPQEADSSEIATYSTTKSFGMVLWGLIGLSLGAQLLVNSAQIIASDYWVSEAVIGLTVVAFWTSLPELATSVIAALKRQSDIVIGNVVGSNIFNLLLVLWATGTVANIPVDDTMLVDISIELFAIITLMITLFFIGKRGCINRIEGISFFLLYCIYIWYITLTQFF